MCKSRCLVLVLYLTMVTNNLQSADHLSYSKETKNLGENNGVGGPLRSVGVSNLAESLAGGGRDSVGESARYGARVADQVCNRLEI